MLASRGFYVTSLYPAQANKWIKAMEGSNLSVVDLNTNDFLRQMGNCIQYGLPCLLQVKGEDTRSPLSRCTMHESTPRTYDASTTKFS